MSKYAALGDYLSQQPSDRIAMTFERIEKVTGEKLPTSARRYRAWWSNNPTNSVMTRVWLTAGFRSEEVNLEGHRLVFRRVRPGESKPAARTTGRHPLIGALKGLIRIEPGTDLTEPADPEWGESAWGK